MNSVRKILLSVLGEKKYLSLLASSFQKLYRRGLMGTDYQDIYFLKKFLRKGDCCIDIGAHLGYFTLEMSRLVSDTGKVYAIEPMSKFYQTLEALLKKENIRNVDLRQLAMGGEGEWVEMGIPQVDKIKKFAYARVKESNTYLEYVESEKVKNEYGDSLFSDLASLDFIKCDVEGLEVSVFSRMLQTLARYRPVLLCELGNQEDRIALFQMLGHLDYEVFFLHDKRLRRLNVSADTKPISHNHYFIPATRLERFTGLIDPN
jgi:FkbM family methyltransferase